MKKIFGILLTFCLVFIAACGTGGSKPAAGTSSAPAASAAPSGSAAPAASAKPAGGKIILKFGHSTTETNFRHLAAIQFKKEVEQKTNGQIEVQVYPGEQLGAEAQMLQSIVTNSIQMTPVATGLYAKYNPKIGVIELPYLFTTFDQAYKVLDGPVGKELADPLVEKGIRILAYWENGFRQLTNSKREITKPEDLKGLKIRTPDIPVSLAVLKAMGANSLGMAFGELYPALEQKVVDGQENPLTNINSSKFYEVQKFLSMTYHQYSPVPLAVSETFWKTLTPDQQKIVQEAATSAGAMMRKMVQEDDKKLKGEFAAKGIKITEPDLKPFQDAVQPVYKEYEGTFGKDLIDKVRNAAK